MYGGSSPAGGDWKPFYPPQGCWRIEARNDQRSEKASGIVTVPGSRQDERVDLRVGDSLAEAVLAGMAGPGCLA